MCPACGTTLQLSSSPLADRQRALISRLVEQNRTKEQIKQALVREFGQEVLASPPDRGFGLSAYAVPLVVLAVTAVALPFALHRWRREKSSPDDEPLIELSDSDADRLDRELELMRRRDD